MVMKSYGARLDKFIAKTLGYQGNQVKLLLAKGQVRLDNQITYDGETLIGKFSKIEVEGQLLRNETPIYLMLHKPVGVVSATFDDEHTTALSLLPKQYHHLHIAGRLDLNSSGLLLFTNDGKWSKKLSHPQTKLPKYYTVGVAKAITDEQIAGFKEGVYFAFEDITTAPATLSKINQTKAQVVLKEGRYHQIKRMFGHFRNPVLSIHRTQIGPFTLPDDLKPGEFRLINHPNVDSL